jgi:7-carboxy-7-deazaguanine synthase
MIKVTEIFTSIQGESSYAGLPCTFIRLSGCNLRCKYCDTRYAFKEGYEMSLPNIINEIKKSGLGLIEVTGGEPLLQKDVFPLITKLLDEGYKVLVETNGSINIKDVDKRAIIILDIKTPNSNMLEKMDFSNLDMIKKDDEIKFVITDREDYEWSLDFIHKNSLHSKCHILMSPAYGFLKPDKLAKWIIDDKLNVRLNIQIHKYIFGDNRKT